MKTGIVILAAGNSSRLGQPKQLLNYNGDSLLNRIISEAVKHVGNAVVVVTGANNSEIEKNIVKDKVIVCHNSLWQQGMSSSIKVGIKHLLLVYPNLEECIITVCDQPFLDASVFEGLTDLRTKSNKGIVVSGYSGIMGVPALFTKSYFHTLLELQGHEGARNLFAKNIDDVAIFSFEKGAVDIDTMEDYNKLINS